MGGMSLAIFCEGMGALVAISLAGVFAGVGTAEGGTAGEMTVLGVVLMVTVVFCGLGAGLSLDGGRAVGALAVLVGEGGTGFGFSLGKDAWTGRAGMGFSVFR